MFSHRSLRLSLATVAWMGVYTASWQARADVPTQDELAITYKAKCESIHTLKIETVSYKIPLADENDLLRHFGYLPPLSGTGVTIQHHDGRYYVEVRSPWNIISGSVHHVLEREHPGLSLREIPFEDVERAAQAEFEKMGREPLPLIFLFDGKKVWKHEAYTELTTEGLSRTGYSVLDPERVSSALLPSCLAHDLLIAFPVPKNLLPKDHAERMENRLPALLASGRYRISSNLHDVDGHACVLVKSESEQIFLDPDLDFALRRRLWKHHDGEPVYELVANDFEEVLPSVWLPRKALYRQYGIAEIAEGRYAGVPLYESHVDVTLIEANNPDHEKYFSVNVQPGNFVVDQTLGALDAEGNVVAPKPPKRDMGRNIIPSVSYIQPADKSDLDEVVLNARREAGIEPPSLADASESERSMTIWILLWFNAGIAVVIGTFIMYRKLIARH